jgi:hypothetical protein
MPPSVGLGVYGNQSLINVAARWLRQKPEIKIFTQKPRGSGWYCSQANKCPMINRMVAIVRMVIERRVLAA